MNLHHRSIVIIKTVIIHDSKEFLNSIELPNIEKVQLQSVNDHLLFWVKQKLNENKKKRTVVNSVALPLEIKYPA